MWYFIIKKSSRILQIDFICHDIFISSKDLVKPNQITYHCNSLANVMIHGFFSIRSSLCCSVQIKVENIAKGKVSNLAPHENKQNKLPLQWWCYVTILGLFFYLSWLSSAQYKVKKNLTGPRDQTWHPMTGK
jgi:hypothetical protein